MLQQLRLLGRPQLLDDGQNVDITSRKGLALLAYLVLSPENRAGRDEAAALLWPEVDDGRSRANLRNLLYELNKTPLANWLNAETETITLQLAGKEVDVLCFLRCLEADDLATAVTYYHGDFLAGFHLSHNEPFADWQRRQQELLQRKMLDALHNLAETAVFQQNFPLAETYARRQIELDNLQESAWRQLMTAQAGNGRRVEAINSYNALTQILQDELGVAPSPETAVLAAQIRSDKAVISETAQPRSKAERILLDKVQSFWIDGVLEQSLHGEALLELGMATHPDALAYPWGMMLQRPSQPAQTLPAHTRMMDLFAQSGHALLILGALGSGKTTMLLDLARAALVEAHEHSAAPIPVVFNLSSWAQAERPLTEWLISELNDKYLIPPNISRDWLRQDKLLLLLDGLDEVKANRQAACVLAINQFRQAHGLAQVVVCSRLQEYEAVGEKLRLETAVILQPLSAQQIDMYLQAGGERLTAVRATLAQDATLREMAQSPLLLSIMTLAYRDFTPEAVQETNSLAERRTHLFDSYVKQMAVRKGESLRYSFDKTCHWLSWLAKRMQQEDQSIFLLEMLQPGWLNGRFQPTLYIFCTRICAGLLIALLISFDWQMILFGIVLGGLTGAFTSYQFRQQQRRAFRYRLPIGKTLLPAWGLLLIFLAYVFTVEPFALSEGVVAAFMSLALAWAPFGILLELRDSRRTPWADIQPVEMLTWSWAKARWAVLRGMVAGTAVALTIGLLLGLTAPGIHFWRTLLLLIFLFGIPVGGCIGLLNGFTRDVIPMKTTPDQSFRLTLRLVLGGALLGALAMGMGFICLQLLFNRGVLPLLVGLQGSLFGAWLGFKFGIGVGLWFGGLDLLYHAFIRLWLRRQEGLPLRFVAFLDDAAHHLYLRKVGNGYMFAHQLLLDYFAVWDSDLA